MSHSIDSIAERALARAFSQFNYASEAVGKMKMFSPLASRSNVFSHSRSVRSLSPPRSLSAHSTMFFDPFEKTFQVLEAFIFIFILAVLQCGCVRLDKLFNEN